MGEKIMVKENLLMEVPRDEVGKIAEKYLKNFSVIENTKKSQVEIESQLIIALRKANRRNISLQMKSGRIITLEIQITQAKEKIKVR